MLAKMIARGKASSNISEELKCCLEDIRPLAYVLSLATELIM